jgi:exopolyphosphatase/guanosine-5'-triphosphate,3'-diphosphate pyrophosphatase
MPRYAAVDIGSNSVRMLAAEVTQSGTGILAEDREVTRLGTSVFRSGQISPEAMDFVCGVLRRMAQTYSRLDVVGMRAVATAAVRDASNQAEFLERASQAIGARVEIISGQEEARLIHLGVQSRWPHPRQRIMIVDVGGGSAELILAQNGQLVEASSKPLGAVRLTGVFLEHDPPQESELRHLQEFIDEKLAPVIRRIGIRPCDRAIATSATAAAMVCAVNRIPRARRDEADRRRASLAEIRKLYVRLCERDRERRARIPGIGPRRAEIIVPGVGVLLRILEHFQLTSFYYSVAGVRDGIIADLAARGVGRELSHLSREQRQVVERMAQKYQTPLPHVRRISAFCHTLYEALHPLHKLPPYYGKLLEAAAHLYEAGQFISDTAHHKHSAYVVQNSDLPGFTDQEKTLIALLCRFHRKSMPSARHTPFQALSPEDRRALLHLIPILRLADALDRSKEQRVDDVECGLRNGEVVVQLKGADVDLEQWAGSRVDPIFRQVYERHLTVTRARRGTGAGVGK